MIYLFVLIGFVGVMLIYGYLSNYILTTSNVELLTDKSVSPMRFVLLSDLHGASFGKNNERLLKRIAELDPDFVVLAGDMVVKNGNGILACNSLCQRLAYQYAVYYAPGNHEIRLPDQEDFTQGLMDRGVTCLRNKHEDFPDDKVTIHGLDLPEEYYVKFWEPCDFSLDTMSELLPYPEGEKYHILIAHNPEYFPIYAKWGADLVLSGHVHGGIVGLPTTGAISPSLRIFPKYTKGVYTEGGSKMILSRGLGLHHIKFRFFNLPEIVVVSVKQKNLANS